MFFQQWSGIDSIIYYASNIFQSVGLTSGTISLLATGVTGIINVLVTLPALFLVDKIGRKPLLIAGSLGMFCSMLIVGIIVALFRNDWASHARLGCGCIHLDLYRKLWLQLVSRIRVNIGTHLTLEQGTSIMDPDL